MPPRPTPPARRTLSYVTRRCIELAEELQDVLSLDEKLGAVARAAAELTRSDQAVLRLLDESGERLLTTARSGPAVHGQGGMPFRVGEGVIGWSVEHREAAMVNDPSVDPRFVVRSNLLWTPSGLLTAPLLAGSQCIGVMSTARSDGRSYTAQDLDLLQLVTKLSVPYLEIARLRRLNESDPLTLLGNRRYVSERLPEAIADVRARDLPLSLAMLDIDHFKHVNDTHGHDVGDEVLVEMAERLRRVTRDSDIVARWGGEEFLLVLAHANRDRGIYVAERLRRTVSTAPFPTTAGNLHVTVSLGVSTLREDDTPEKLTRRADQALYRAKRKGRNRVEA